jgi:nucleoid DNA-binding protein
VRQARELGRKLVRSRKEKAVNPEAEEVRKSFEEKMSHLMFYRDDALIGGFGKFSLRRNAPRKGKNLATGGNVPCEGRTVVQFRCSPVLRDSINGKG